jgi:Rrf2 family protein
MRLSTRGRYGVRVLLELALQNGKTVPLKDIARSQEISLLYLEHLIAPLISAKIVRSTRGARGGIKLVKAPENIKLSEVVELLEGSITPVDCVDDPKVCPRSKFCATRDVWAEVKRAIENVLESKTLQDLVEMHKSKGRIATEEMYYI